MRSPPPPLRFLIVVLGGWTAARAVLLTSFWSAPAAVAEEREAEKAPVPHAAIKIQLPQSSLPITAADDTNVFHRTASLAMPTRIGSASSPFFSASPHSRATLLTDHLPALRSSPLLGESVVKNVGYPSPLQASPLPSPAASLSRRWSVSAWAFVRQGDAPSLAPAGLLGGGQAGLRLGYRLNGDMTRPLTLTGRVYLPTRQRRGAEAALGLDWKPLRRLPLHLVAERRQAVGPEGRSALGVSAYGGLSELELGAFRLDAYGQGGVVGARRRDLFVDGTARFTLPLGKRLRVGVGGWAAAQPGVSRVDAGPHASFRLPVGSGGAVISADWRLRIAGNARPGSGPALTLATDF